MSALYSATQQRESTSCVATSYSIPSARDDPSGSNSKLQEMISSVPGSEVEESFSFSFAFSTEFDSDCQYSETVRGPSISPTRMSPADELFQNGKIRPLQVSPQTNSVSFYEEIPETARVEVHEAYGYQFRRSASFEILNSKVIASTSATDCWEDAEIVDYRLSCGGEGIKEREKGDGHKTNWDSKPPTSILNHCAAPEPKTRNHVIHRRCHTLTPLSSLFHIDERKEFITGDSSESGTKAIRGRRSSNAEDHDQQQAWTLKTSKGPGRTLRLKELLWNKDSSKDQQQKVDEFEGLNSKECCMRQLMTESNTNYSSKNFKLQDSSTNLSNNLSTNLSGTAMVKEMKNSSSARVDALQCRYNKGNIGASSPQQSTLSSSSSCKRSSNIGAASPRSSLSSSSCKRSNGASLHELHYGGQRAEAEKMRMKTLLPYRQGLLGCLTFPPRSSYLHATTHR